jgi:MFS family permease
MQRKQLIALAICNMGVYVMGIMALSLLPVYAVQLGMDEGAIGILLALAFAALTAGSLSSGWFSDRFQRRKLTMIVACIIGVPATFLMGQVGSLLALTLVTLIMCFAAGIITAMVNILAGMYASPNERGRVFGILGTSIALANIVAGLASGAIVDRWGYAVLFDVTALVWLVSILGALFLSDTITTRLPVGQPKPAAVRLSSAIWLLILANILISIPGFIGNLARPLIMNGLGFAASDISNTFTVSGLVSLPLPFLVGWLSDRTGRKQLLIAGYMLASLGMLVLIGALHPVQFWLSSSLIALAGGVGGVASALVTDLAPPEALGTALARFSATPWIAAVVGYGVTGYVIQLLGVSSAMLIGAVLPVIAIFALLSIRKGARPVPVLNVIQGAPRPLPEDKPAA